MICVDYAKGALTKKEARAALGEMRVKIGNEHAEEIARRVQKDEEEEEANAKKQQP